MHEKRGRSPLMFRQLLTLLLGRSPLCEEDFNAAIGRTAGVRAIVLQWVHVIHDHQSECGVNPPRAKRGNHARWRHG